MNMAGSREVLATCSKRDCGGGFVNQIAGMWANDVNSENAVRFGVGEDLHTALQLPKGSRARIRAEWKCSFAIFSPERFQFILGFAGFECLTWHL